MKVSGNAIIPTETVTCRPYTVPSSTSLAPPMMSETTRQVTKTLPSAKKIRCGSPWSMRFEHTICRRRVTAPAGQGFQRPGRVRSITQFVSHFRPSSENACSQRAASFPCLVQTQRLGARGHVAKAAQPDEAVSGVEVAELTEEPDARRSLRLDEFTVEEGDQVLTPARLESVLPQLDD